ncbi:MAG: hypothetical protein JST75_00770 [Bacteroidetes bacterium]|nr:hypothetical protein [Bacteroidota bacterium]
MRKTASILLLGILLFNWFGYRLLTSYMQSKADVQLRTSLDNNNFDESQLVSVKVPATNLGYYVNAAQFERVDGTAEINGVQYNYVKRRVFNDSIEMLCIPNHTAMQLKNAKDEFFKLVNDLQTPGQGKKSDSHATSYKSFSIDYYSVNSQFDLSTLYFTTTKKVAHYIFTVPSYFTLVSEQPPDVC